MTSKKRPGLVDMGKNLYQSLTDVVEQFITDGSLMVEENEYEDRMAVCRECDSYDAKEHRCNECGCFLSVKGRLLAVYCPLYKWPGDALKAMQEGE